MHSLTEATYLINGSADRATLHAIVAELGFTGTIRALDDAARDRLGLPSAVTDARIARGPGVLRALVLELAHDVDVRATLATIARRLSSRVPHLLWLMIVVQQLRTTFAIATWQITASTQRVLTLITDRGCVLDSDAETLCALCACHRGTPGDVMLHLRWLDVLGREAITRRFFRAFERSMTALGASLAPSVPSAPAREIALLTGSRLLFLSFLETKGWLDSDFCFLANGFADCMMTGGGYHRRVLDPLFFGTLNTATSKRAARARAFGRIPFLNGGLFARSPVERAHRHSRFSDDALGALFGDVLVRYRFTPREDMPNWSEASIDPEILGRAFESLMTMSKRKQGGVYYTPQSLVERLASRTLATALVSERISEQVAQRVLAGEMNELDAERRVLLLQRTAEIRILDPACGSGAFLIHALECIASLRASLGDTRPIATIRRSVLTQSIYGVDIDPTAVWLCELRLWLATVIDSEVEDPMRVIPLPNLDRQIRVGDSLAGMGFAPGRGDHASRTITALRQRYARATGPRKVSLARALDRAERQRAMVQIDRALTRTHAARREIVCAARTRDLFQSSHRPDSRTQAQLDTLRRTVRMLGDRRSAIANGAALPFSYAVHFADVMDDGGFHVVLGNPPWVRIHNVSPAAREGYRESFHTFRHAAWTDGAGLARAGSGFAGQVDTAALFVERSHSLVVPNGVVGLLLPSKLWRSLAGGGVRRLVMKRTHLIELEDHSEAAAAFGAVVYPSLLVARRNGPASGTGTTHTQQPARIAIQRTESVLSWTVRPETLALDDTPGSPWLIVPPEVRAAFDRVTQAGLPMARCAPGRPWLGVKTGCNAAFVVRVLSTQHDTALISNGVRTGTVEHALLRPLVRGETLTAWKLADSGERMIWTHDRTPAPLRELPPNVMEWLTHWKRRLERRSDVGSRRPWWSVFRVEAADPSTPRVVWNDLGRTPRAAVLLPGDSTVPLNTCYVARCKSVDDAYALAALLNSPLVAAWLAVVAEPARGGYHRYLGWTLALLPLPRDWERAQLLLSPLARRAIAGDVPSPSELHQATLAAYQIPPDAVTPLLEWTSI